MGWTLAASLLFFVFITVVCSQENLTLTTNKGPIVGLRITSNPGTGASYDAFIGIPYGQIPARFQLAIARSNWTEPLYTQTDGPACPQPNVTLNEDCLYLNVFTPLKASISTTKLPVMAFIHGSAFTFASSSSKRYGPDFLVPAGVILVTMNYRLGAAGFLTMGSKIAPGNLGLHDTALALQWIQEEISNFGGDPTKVTLFGQSAGSVMTQFHYISSLTSGLFTKAIAQSGSALAGWGMVSPMEGARRAKLLAQALHCDTNQNDSVVLTCLQKADIKDVVSNQSITLPSENVVSGNGLPFVPVMDNYLTADKPFFNDSLLNLMKAALDRAKPFITGFTTDEGILRFSGISYFPWNHTETHLSAFIPHSILSGINEDKKDSLVSNIKNRYFSQAPDDNKVQDLVRLFTDSMFAYPAIKVSRYFANLTYGYLFAYDGSWAPSPTYFAHYKFSGVNHGDDLKYLFYTNGSFQYMDTCTSNKDNLNIMTQMVKWWTTFASTGVPDPSWKTISSGGYLAIDSTTSTMNISTIESRYYSFWAGIESAKSSAATKKFNIIALFAALLIMVFVHLQKGIGKTTSIGNGWVLFGIGNGLYLFNFLLHFPGVPFSG